MHLLSFRQNYYSFSLSSLDIDIEILFCVEYYTTCNSLGWFWERRSRREIAASLNDFSNCWCKRENVEPDPLKEWKLTFLKLLIYSHNTHLLPPKSSFRHLKRGIQDFHMNYVLIPSDQAANNVVVV